jgi:DNA-binding winged helix-turn-helix (wHTH) protein
MAAAQVRFGSWLFDHEARELRRDDRTVALSPKAFDLLGALLARRPAVVSKEALRDVLWPRTCVGQTSLPRIVTELRRALGDDTASPRYVRTVHGFGYAFVGGTLEAGPAAALLRSGSREFLLREGENLIGRSAECLVRIASPRVSRRHARVVVTAGAATIEDLGSKNGTFVEGKRITEPTRLHDGAQVGLGLAVLVFVSGGEDYSTESDSGL